MWTTTTVEHETPKSLIEHIDSLCVEYNVDFNIIMAIIEIESLWNDSAMSRDGYDIGLMQIRITTARGYYPNITKNELKNSYKNVEIGIKHYRYLLDYYDEHKSRAIVAYNWGQKKVNKMSHNRIINTKYFKKFNVSYNQM